MSRLLYSEEVVRLMRRELKKALGINFEPDVIKEALRRCIAKAVNTDSMRLRNSNYVRANTPKQVHQDPVS
jgi:hypothetical protein